MSIMMDLGENKLYNVKSILNNFEEYLGINIIEIEDILNNYKVISFSDIEKYLRNNQDKIIECKYNISIDTIIKDRLYDYNYLKKILSIFQIKALKYIELLKYISNLTKIEEIKEYENVLNECELFHYSSIMTGKDLNRILSALSYTIREFQDTLIKINKKNTYHNQIVDNFLKIYGANKMYPSTNLIQQKNTIIDKTSIQLLSKRNNQNTNKYIRVKKIVNN